MHAPEPQRQVASMTNEELQALLDNTATPFPLRVNAFHARLRRDARKATSQTPFLDRRQLRIESSEYRRALLALK